MRWRIAYAMVPQFVQDVFLRTLPEHQRTGPLAYVEDKTHRRVKELNQKAYVAGIRIGYTAARAQSMCPNLRCIPWQNELVEAAQSRLKEALLSISPIVHATSDAYGCYWLDARGMSLLGGERAFVQRAIKAMGDIGYSDVRIGVADTLQSARICAQKASTQLPYIILQPEQKEEFIEQLSLDYLSLDEHMANVLNALGFTHIDQIKALPKCTLVSRFGQQGERVWDAIHDQDHRTLQRTEHVEVSDSVLVLDNPVSNLNSLIFAVKQLAEELAINLSQQVMAAASIGLFFLLEDQSEHAIVLHPTRPLHDGHGLFELIRDRLDHRSPQLDSGVVEVKLVALDLCPIEPQQLHMGASKWDENAIERMLDRLAGRFDAPIVFESKPQNDLRPEHAARWVTVSTSSNDKHVNDSNPPRLESIRRRLQSSITLDISGDDRRRPDRIRINKRWYPFRVYGPERISGGWWQPAFSYEDFRLVTPEHEVLWIRYEPEKSRWSMQGWFD
ncbi:MAG: Y-family DNA polymerase [Bradymonadia bacterium]